MYHLQSQPLLPPLTLGVSYLTHLSRHHRPQQLIIIILPLFYFYILKTSKDLLLWADINTPQHVDTISRQQKQQISKRKIKNLLGFNEQAHRRHKELSQDLHPREAGRYSCYLIFHPLFGLV